jgi:predicted ATPase
MSRSSPLGPMPIKGMERPVEVYELVGPGPRRSRVHAAATRGLTRFVGRDHELDQLWRALARAAAGHGQIVAIVGEPGVGKSRLIWEVTHSPRVHAWLVLQAGSVSYGGTTPYLPIVDLLKSHFGIEPRDEASAIREKVEGRTRTLDESLTLTVPAILSLLGVPVDDPQWLGLDPQQRRQHALHAVKRLLIRESQTQPVLVVLEDLHWIDSETQAVLDSVVDSLPTTRILLVTSYRPEYAHGWSRKTYYTQIRLDPLAAETAEALLRALVGVDPGLEPLKALLIDRTEGNPFFLEEMVQTLIETRVLSDGPRGYRVVKPVDQTQIPVTVQAVLAARIDRLPPDEKRLLQSASVLGKDVPVRLLRAIADVPDDSIRHGLAHLHAAEFLYETSPEPDPEYTFKHALTHDVAYAGLLQERRRALHASIVEAAERLAPEWCVERPGWLGHHAWRGEAWDKGVSYLRSAGVKAAGQAASAEARIYFEQALAALGNLPSSPASGALGIDLRCELETPLMHLGAFETGLERLREAEALAHTTGDRNRLARVLGRITYNLASLGHLNSALEAGERAAAAFTDEGEPHRRLSVDVVRARARYGLGDYRQAIEICQESERLVETRGPLPPGWGPVYIRIWRVLCLAELGQFTEAEVWGEKAVSEAETSGGPPERVWACIAIAVLEPALRMFEGGGLTRCTSPASRPRWAPPTSTAGASRRASHSCSERTP